MTFSVDYDGSTLDAPAVLLGSSSLASAADATISAGSIIFDDPDGTREIVGHRPISANESDCTAAPRLFTGYVGARTYSRGTYGDGAARIIDTTIIDQNAVLGFELITGADGKRPAETHIERIDWLLGSAYLSGLIVDNGEVYRGNPRPFGEADYIGSYPYEVLNDISAPIFQTYFAYWDQAAEEVALFFNQPNATTMTSTLTISNVRTDESPTCFFPFRDAAMTRDPQDVYSTVRMTHRYGSVVAHRASTATAFIERGLQVNNDRIGLASALVMSESLLDRSADESDTITVTIQVPSSQVGLIDYGMRLGVRFTHLPGFETLTYSRVAKKTLKHVEGRRDLYEMGLELSTHGLSPGGGGAGGFPYQTGCTNLGLVHYYYRGGDPEPGSTPLDWSGTPTQGAAFVPTAGNVLLLLGDRRGTTIDGTVPTGWTKLVSVDVNVGVAAFAKVSDGTETQFVMTTHFPGDWVIYEVAGVTLTGVLTASVDTHAGSATWTSGSVTPSAGNGVFIAGLIGGFDDTWLGFGTPAAGWTEYGDSIGARTNGPHTTTLARVVTSASGSYDPTTVVTVTAGSSPHQYSGVTVGLVCVGTNPADEPPISGQWFYDVIPTPAADGSTVTFTLPAGYEFADGSLLVKVDRLDQTAAVTSYDGVARTFTLGFAPKTGELIEVTGQSR